MVNHCVVSGCNFKYTSRSRTPEKQNVSLHGFPSETRRRELREAWIKAVRREGWQPTKHSSVCSQHFRPEDMDYTGQTRRLRDGAIPSVFPSCPKHCREDVKILCKPPKCCVGLDKSTAESVGLDKLKTESTPNTSRDKDSSELFEHNACLEQTVLTSLPPAIGPAVLRHESFSGNQDSAGREICRKMSGQVRDLAEDPLLPYSCESSFRNNIELTPCRRMLHDELNETNYNLINARKKIKVLQQKVRRQKRIINSNREIINSLVNEKLITKCS